MPCPHFNLSPLFPLLLAGGCLALLPVQAADPPTDTPPNQSPADFSAWGGANTEADSDAMWQPLREKLFGNRTISEGADSRINLEAPTRAENDALVPVSIRLQPAAGSDTAADPVRRVWLVVDVNPAPVGGVFTLTEKRPMEQLTTQVRVNGYTYIRALAETQSGRLYMSKQWVKNTGAGCSAPPGIDQAQHKKRLGKMRLRMTQGDELSLGQRLQLIISHPNNTGMQKDQLSTLLIPEHYVTGVRVTFNEELLLEAETTFTLSENPNFSFSFDPHESGVLRAEMTDSQHNTSRVETVIQGPG
ncbi:MAG TPA: quinoprotein dehydrogenase-associated SoxYZ-like carrier [Thiolinea sp.]|nr:quinoprotein dehydrogenase-associated SoxYZ-like carrier [Thiolinea sp.]